MITPMPPRQTDSVVGVLTDLLAKATRGEIVEVAAAVIYADGDVGMYCPSTAQHYKLAGAVHGLLHDMQAQKREEADG